MSRQDDIIKCHLLLQPKQQRGMELRGWESSYANIGMFCFASCIYYVEYISIYKSITANALKG
jgi:hypothetical protein